MKPTTTKPFAALLACSIVACGPEAQTDTQFVPPTQDKGRGIQGNRVVRGGTVVRTATGTCTLSACQRACPQPSFADVVVARTGTAAVVCYPLRTRLLVPRPSESINLNGGNAVVTIDLSRIRGGIFRGDININSVGSATILGRTSTPTVVLGNINLHAGDVRLVNLDVQGDVSINRNQTQSALVDSIVRRNLNVHVSRFVGLRSDVFGDFNLNRDRAVLSGFGFGQRANIHGAPRLCENFGPFRDLNGDGRVQRSERSPGRGCP